MESKQITELIANYYKFTRFLFEISQQLDAMTDKFIRIQLTFF